MIKKYLPLNDFQDLSEEPVSPKNRLILLSPEGIEEVEEKITRPEPSITKIYTRFISTVIANTQSNQRLEVPGIAIDPHAQNYPEDFVWAETNSLGNIDYLFSSIDFSETLLEYPQIVRHCIARGDCEYNDQDQVIKSMHLGFAVNQLYTQLRRTGEIPTITVLMSFTPQGKFIKPHSQIIRTKTELQGAISYADADKMLACDEKANLGGQIKLLGKFGKERITESGKIIGKMRKYASRLATETLNAHDYQIITKGEFGGNCLFKSPLTGPEGIVLGVAEVSDHEIQKFRDASVKLDTLNGHHTDYYASHNRSLRKTQDLLNSMMLSSFLSNRDPKDPLLDEPKKLAIYRAASQNSAIIEKLLSRTK